MNSESKRLQTLADWEYHILDKQLLSLTGFFANTYGHLKCYYCNFHIHAWTSWVDEIELHRNNSPTCRIFSDVSLHTPQLKAAIQKQPPQTNDLVIHLYGIHHMDISTALAEKYDTTANRKQSFYYAPQPLNKISNKLVDAGFFLQSKKFDNILF